MTEDEAIALVVRLLGCERLNQVQQFVFQQSWKAQKYSEMVVDKNYDLGYIKDVGSGLWRSLSQALGEKVTKNNLHGVLDRFVQRQEEAQQTLKMQTFESCRNWGEAIDVSIFYGRNQELVKLKTWIGQDHCRIVSIISMGGMGKTSLAIKLGEEIQEKFDFVIWRSLRDAMPIDEYLTILIKFLSQQQETELPDNTGGKISRLIEILKRSRCLIILDNFETVLQSGKQLGTYREGYEMYGEMLKRVGEVSHQSCLIVTSREKPQEIAMMEGERLFVRTMPLLGLDIVAGQHILDDKGLHTIGDDLEELSIHYRGNPLALKMAATSIQAMFAGDITQFLQQGNFAFNGIGKLIQQQCDRLSTLEQSVMNWLAINREPVAIEDLQIDLVIEISRSKLIEAVESLRWRSLIERSASGFTQQPVVMESVTESLIERIAEEILLEKPKMFLNYSLIKAQAKDYIRDSQIRIILQPLCNLLLSEISSSQLEHKLKSLLKHLQINYAKQSNYGAGNLLNLLRQLQIDVTGFDFTKLHIKQAYLQDINLHKVDFTEAEFENCTFTCIFGGITSVAFSPDGEQIATSDTNGSIQIWNLKDGQQLALCLGHNSWVWDVAYSPSQPIIASCGQDHQVRLWDIHTGKCLKLMEGHTGIIGSVSFSPDGKMLASTSGDHTIRLWHVETGKCVQILYGHKSYVWSTAFLSDGKTLFSAGGDNMIRRWCIESGECVQILSGHQHLVRSIALSRDETQIMSGSFDQTLKIWDIATGICLATLNGHQAPITAISLSADGKTLTSSSYDHTVKLWCVESKQCLQTLQKHTNLVWSVACHPHLSMLVSTGEDRTTRFWNMQTGQCTKTMQGHSNSIYAIAYSPKHQLLASGHEDQTIKLWNFNQNSLSERSTLYPFRTLRGHTGRVLSVAFSPDAQILASGSPDHTIKLWNSQTGNCLRTLRGHIRWVWEIAFHPHNKLLASASDDHTIRLWELETGDCLHILQNHNSTVLSVAFSPDSKWLVSGGYEQTIKLWNPATGACVYSLKAHLSRVWKVAFSPDSRWFATGGDDHMIRLWDVATGKCLNIFTGHTNQVISLLFSANGNQLISSSADKTIRIWNLKTGECTDILEQHQHWVWSLAQVLDHGKDEGFLLSSSQDETIKIWNLQDRSHLKTLRCPLPYEKSIITNTTGLTEAQKMTLQALGAIT
jgi:WD40 repeat protein